MAPIYNATSLADFQNQRAHQTKTSNMEHHDAPLPPWYHLPHLDLRVGIGEWANLPLVARVGLNAYPVGAQTRQPLGAHDLNYERHIDLGVSKSGAGAASVEQSTTSPDVKDSNALPPDVCEPSHGGPIVDDTLPEFPWMTMAAALDQPRTEHQAYEASDYLTVQTQAASAWSLGMASHSSPSFLHPYLQRDYSDVSNSVNGQFLSSPTSSSYLSSLSGGMPGSVSSLDQAFGQPFVSSPSDGDSLGLPTSASSFEHHNAQQDYSTDPGLSHVHPCGAYDAGMDWGESGLYDGHYSDNAVVRGTADPRPVPADFSASSTYSTLAGALGNEPVVLPAPTRALVAGFATVYSLTEALRNEPVALPAPTRALEACSATSSSFAGALGNDPVTLTGPTHVLVPPHPLTSEQLQQVNVQTVGVGHCVYGRGPQEVQACCSIEPLVGPSRHRRGTLQKTSRKRVQQMSGKKRSTLSNQYDGLSHQPKTWFPKPSQKNESPKRLLYNQWRRATGAAGSLRRQTEFKVVWRCNLCDNGIYEEADKLQHHCSSEHDLELLEWTPRGKQVVFNHWEYVIYAPWLEPPSTWLSDAALKSNATASLQLSHH